MGKKEDRNITFADTEAGGEIREQAEYEETEKRLKERIRNDKEAVLAIMAVLNAKHYSVEKAFSILDMVKGNISRNTKVVDPVSVMNEITLF